MERFGHVIDGVEEIDGATFDSVDPWTREPWATVALGGAAEADRAVAAARRAFDEGPWPRMGFAERGAIIHRFSPVDHLAACLIAAEAGAAVLGQDGLPAVFPASGGILVAAPGVSAELYGLWSGALVR